MSAQIHEQSIISAAPEQISSDLAGETVVLDPKEGAYYSLHNVGARIWELVQQPRCVADIRTAIAEEYDVDPERWDADLEGFLGELESAGLIEVSNEPVA